MQIAPIAFTPSAVPVTVDSEKCIAHKGCTVCVDVCPLDVLAIDVTKGFSVHARTSWLPVDRHDGNCRARDERLTTDSLEGLYEQVGRNTGYLIHPEEILADTFALLFRAPAKIASPEVPTRIERILRR